MGRGGKGGGGTFTGDIVNLLGEKVIQQSIKPQLGENEIVLELDNIESGVYYLNMHNARNEKILRKIIKQ